MMGWGKVDITNPAITFKFGELNSRKIDDRQLKLLRKSLDDEGHIWYRIENMLPLIVADPSWIDEKTLTKDVTQGTKMPNLALTKAGHEKMSAWVMAGGQHRVKAVEQILSTKTRDLDKLQKERNATTSKKGDPSKRATTITHLDEAIRAKSKELEDLKWWGVIVYDKRKYFLYEKYSSCTSQKMRQKDSPFCACFCGKGAVLSS
jgi:hypothetical protein